MRFIGSVASLKAVRLRALLCILFSTCAKVVSADCPEIQLQGDTIYVCSGQAVTLDAQIYGDYDSVYWSGGVGFFNPNSQSLNFSYEPDSTEYGTVVALTLVATPINSACTADTDTIYIQVVVPPVVDAGSDFVFCGGAAITLNARFGGGATGVQWFGGAGTFYPDNYSSNVTYIPDSGETGLVTFTLYALQPGDACQYEFDSTVVDIREVRVDAGPDLHVCYGNQVLLSGSVSGAVASGQWSGGGGKFQPGRFSPQALYSPFGFEAGSILSLVLTADSVSGCPIVSDTMLLTVELPADVTVTGNIKGCPGDAISMNATLSGGSGTGHWSGGAGNYSPSAQDMMVEYYPSVAENGQRIRLYFIADSVPSQACPGDSDFIDIQVSEQAIAFAGPDTVICRGDSLTLGGMLNAYAVAAVWRTSGDGTFTDSDSLNTFYIPGNSDIAAGSVLLTLEPVSAMGDCRPIADELLVWIINASAGPDLSTCDPSGTVVLQGNVSGGGGQPAWALSNGSGVLIDTTSLAPTYLPDYLDATSPVPVSAILYYGDSVGCPVSDTALIYVSAGITTVISYQSSSPSCFGSSDGEAYVFIDGGSAPYTLVYGNAFIADSLISNSQSFTITGLSSGLYDYIAFDIAGCSYPGQFPITDPSPLEALAVISDSIDCFGDSALVTVTAGGGTVPYFGDTTYRVPAGTHSFNVIDANACIATVSIFVDQPQALGASVFSTPIRCFGDSSEVALTASGGTFPYIGEGNSQLPAGSYLFTVSDANGCTATSSLLLTEPPPLTATWVATAPSCPTCPDGSVALTNVSGGNGPYSYLPSDSLSGLLPDTHCITVTSADGCVQEFCTQLIVDDDTCDLTVTAGNDVGLCDINGSASVQASVSGNYDNVQWTTNGFGYFIFMDSLSVEYFPDAGDPFLGGLYLVVTATDSSGCSASDTVNVDFYEEVSAFAFEIAPPTCNGASDGIAFVNIISGSAPYSIDYTSSSAQGSLTVTGLSDTISGLPADFYSYTVTSADGCVWGGYFEITSPSPPEASFNIIDSIDCFGGSGSVNINPFHGTAPYTINGVAFAGQSFSVVGGDNTFLLADANGCSSTITVTVPQPDSLSLLFRAGTIACFGDSTSVELIPVGGTAPYSNAGTVTVLAGINSFSIADANGCTASTTVTISQPDPLRVHVTAYPVSCAGCSDGYLLVDSISGGTPGYNFVPPFNLFPGIYCVNVQDSRGCTAQACDTVEGFGCSLAVTVTDSIPIRCNGGPGAVYVQVSGGQAPYAGDGLITAYAGTHIYTVTDASGCSGSATITLTEPARIRFTGIEARDVSCFGESDGSIDITVTGGSGGLTYQWSDGPVTEDRTGLLPGFYTVTVSDVNSCTAQQPVIVGQPVVLSVSALLSQPTCNGYTNGSVQLVTNGGVGGYSYIWSNGNTTPTVDSLPSGPLSVTVLDSNGCTVDTAFSLSQPPALLLSSVETDVECYDASIGSIDLTVTGGVAPYQYSWNTPQSDTIEDVQFLQAGTYVVLVTDASGCTASDSSTILQPSGPLNVQYSVVSISCGTSAMIDLTVAGGTGPYAYLWSDGSTGQDITVTSDGSYTVVVTDVNSCSATTSVDVIGISDTLSLSVSATDITCAGAVNGSIDLTVSGGIAPFHFLWSNNDTVSQLAGLSPGTYSVVVTDFLGCTATTQVTLTEPPAILLTAVVDSVDCNGGDNGSIDLTVAGGIPGYAYLWTPTGSRLEDQYQLTSGNYAVTVTDDQGCTASLTLAVLQPSPIITTALPTPVACYGDTTGRVDLSVTGGSVPYSYQWSNGASTQDISGLGAGTYQVTVADEKGCTASMATVVSQAPAPLVLNSTVTPVICAGGTNGSISIQITGGAVPYQLSWSDGSTGSSLDSLSAGAYTATVTDSFGCIVAQTYTLADPPAISITAITTPIRCNGGSDGSLSLTVSGGIGAYNYYWSPGGATTSSIDSLIAGAYTCTVTDQSGCTVIRTFNLVQPSAISLTVLSDDVSCFGGSDGAADLTVSGGIYPYTYSWGGISNSQDLDSLAAGTYSVTVTDEFGCTATTSVVVSQPDSALAIAGSVTDVSCNGSATGSISVVVSGGTPVYTYSWSSGAVTPTVSNLTAGTYTVTVTDRNGCLVQAGYTVNQSSTPFAVTATVQPVSCNGLFDGAVDLTVSGGQAPYTYTWNGVVSPSADLTGVPAGTYRYRVSDAAGCSDSGTVVIQQPDLLRINSQVRNIGCYGASTGVIDLSVVGGTRPYTYSWNGGSVLQDQINVPAGTYSVVVTDSNGCSLSASYTLLQPSGPISISATVTGPSCNGAIDGRINLNVIGGTGPYAYSWSNGSITEDLSAVGAGTYTVNVLDSAACPASFTATLTEPAPITAALSVVDVTCAGAADGSVNLVIGGVNTPFAVLWSNGATSLNISGVSAGNYGVLITDAVGCTVTAAASVLEPAPLVISYQVTDVACSGGATGAIDLSVTGGTSPYSILWSNGAISEDLSGLVAGLYEVGVSDANGCVAVASIRVGESSPIRIAVSGTDAYCAVAGLISANVTGGSAPYNFAWSSGATTSVISHTTGGLFTVTVTDNNGCTASDSVTVRRITASPAAAGPISGPSIVCDFNAVVYSIAPVAGATSYQWTLPPRCTGWSNGTSITVSFQGGYQSGTICVSAYNGCGAGTPSCISVVLTQTKPRAPSTINGPVYACSPGTYTYTVSTVSNATGYDWAVSGAGATIVSGNGTGTIQLSTGAGFIGGILSVAGTNCNGRGQTTDIVLYALPQVDSSLTGPNTPCPNSTHNFSIPDVPGAVTYAWTISGNAVVLNSNGRSCTVRFNANWNGGVLSVAVSNPCGTVTRSFPLAGAPPAPVSLTGPTSGLCVTTTAGSIYATYTCSPVPGATVYNWSLPRGMAIVSNTGTQIVVEVRRNFTSGTVCVSAGNGCATGVATCIAVTNVPAAPVISGPLNVCLSSVGVPYTVTPVIGAVSYNWSSGSGALLTASGNAASVDFRGTVGSNVLITASVSNACGTGPSASLSVAVNRTCRQQQASADELVFPNPAHDRLQVRAVGEAGVKYTIEVIDLLGRVLVSGTETPTEDRVETAVDLSEVPAGLYLLRISNAVSGERKEFRFIKE